uniref:Protein YIPF n=1 Tax=Fibrocapsa japonica TaxID=94617 RepID=A0A7S2UYF6_9STRA|mmetsp:Transcript_20220/g.29219  ORF Transcript_20220/g.29219 Transcript_20220/m.29219 type:complete len:301 (+) Transcript_20220:75-977(+)
MMNTENEFEGKDDKDFLKQLDEEYGTGEAQGPETVVVANTVPGAAAASSSNGPTIAPFVVQHQQPELSNIDIQPSATAAAAMDDDRESLLGKESPEPNMWCGCLSVRFYQKYVDVDTDDVVNRLKSSVLFCKPPQNFLELLGDRPDAYGPFWVATTLVFFMSVATNIFQWAHHTSDSIWEYDMNAVVSIASIIYAWLVFIPLLTYIACQQLGVSISFIQLFSVYGYSLFVYVPLALLCLIPNNLVIWLCLVAAGVVSSAFLFRALSPTILNGCKDHGVKIVSAVVSANLVLTLVMKFVLF